MIKVFYTKIYDKEVEEIISKKIFEILPPDLKNEISKFMFKKDRNIRIAGKLMLILLLFEFGYSIEVLANITRNEYGKPEIPDTFNFSISHSEDIVICAASRNIKVGVDIEAIRNVDLIEFRDSFTENEWHEIICSENPNKRFFDLWVKKESVIKTDGRGLFINLNDVVISNATGYINDTKEPYHFFPVSGIDNNFISYICTNNDNERIEVKNIDIKDIFFNNSLIKKISF